MTFVLQSFSLQGIRTHNPLLMLGDSLTPKDTGPRGGLSPAGEDDRTVSNEPGSEALVFLVVTDPEGRDPGPLLYESPDCSLTPDCSEGANSKPGGEELEKEREGG